MMGTGDKEEGLLREASRPCPPRDERAIKTTPESPEEGMERVQICEGINQRFEYLLIL